MRDVDSREVHKKWLRPGTNATDGSAVGAGAGASERGSAAASKNLLEIKTRVHDVASLSLRDRNALISFTTGRTPPSRGHPPRTATPQSVSMPAVPTGAARDAVAAAVSGVTTAPPSRRHVQKWSVRVRVPTKSGGGTAARGSREAKLKFFGAPEQIALDEFYGSVAETFGLRNGDFTLVELGGGAEVALASLYDGAQFELRGSGFRTVATHAKMGAAAVDVARSTPCKGHVRWDLEAVDSISIAELDGRQRKPYSAEQVPRSSAL
eukprot:SAG11_NODE_8377_length_1023_cov_0.836580_1_plen_265_part_10